MKTIVLDGVTYKLVPLNDEKTTKTILEDYLSPGLELEEEKDDKQSISRVQRSDVSGQNLSGRKDKGVHRAEGKVSQYREKFKGKKLTPFDFAKPKMSRQEIIKPNQTQMDSISEKAGEDVWFGEGVQQTW